MPRPVTAGVDGSPESLAAAGWAAREARRRGTSLHLVHAWQWEPANPPPSLPGPDTVRHWAEHGLRETATELLRGSPDLRITTEQVTESPERALAEAAKGAEMLVLGSRGLSGLSGFLFGSVGQATLAHAERPVVLVRAGTSAGDEHLPDVAGAPSTGTAFREVVVGLNPGHPCDTLIEFAFDAAIRRHTGLRVVRTWAFPPVYGYAPGAVDPDLATEMQQEEARALAEVLRPWRAKYPETPVTEEVLPGRAAQHLVSAAEGAGLLVVGRRARRSVLGAHIGPVTHAALHHARCPVAVVSHD